MAILTSAQVYPWEGNVGVDGGIPSRETIYTTLSPGVSATGISNTLKSCPSGQVVQLNAGTYDLGGGVIDVDSDSDWTLRGAGMGQTTLTNVRFNLGQYWDTWNTPTNVTAASKGVSTITVASVADLSAGNLVLIEQDNDAEVFGYGAGGSGSPTSNSISSGRERNNLRNQHCMNKIVSIDGTDLTLEVPIPFELEASRNPRLVRHTQPGPQNAGIEDLTVDQNNSSTNPCLWFKGAYGCWWKNVELKNWTSYGIEFGFCFRCEVRGCYIHDPSSFTNSRGYCLQLNPACNCLIVDNVFTHFQSGITFQGGTAANVVAYNAVFDCNYDGGTDGVFLPAIYGNHTPYPCFNLFEGNCSNGFAADNYYGPSGYGTLLRNFLTGTDPVVDPTASSYSNRKVLSIDAHQLHYNVIGNVLGQSPVPASIDLDLIPATRTYDESGFLTWQQDAGTVDGFSALLNIVYRLGYPFIGNNGYDAIGTNLDDLDETVRDTITLHGNWDADTETVEWDAGIADHDVPDSYFLSAKPSWFGNRNWPPYESSTPSGADLEAIPAGYRLVNNDDPPPAETTTHKDKTRRVLVGSE
jgi:hypothetical protein